MRPRHPPRGVSASEADFWVVEKPTVTSKVGLNVPSPLLPPRPRLKALRPAIRFSPAGAGDTRMDFLGGWLVSPHCLRFRAVEAEFEAAVAVGVVALFEDAGDQGLVLVQ